MKRVIKVYASYYLCIILWVADIHNGINCYIILINVAFSIFNDGDFYNFQIQRYLHLTK